MAKDRVGGPQQDHHCEVGRAEGKLKVNILFAIFNVTISSCIFLQIGLSLILEISSGVS